MPAFRSVWKFKCWSCHSFLTTSKSCHGKNPATQCFFLVLVLALIMPWHRTGDRPVNGMVETWAWTSVFWRKYGIIWHPAGLIQLWNMVGDSQQPHIRGLYTYYKDSLLISRCWVSFFFLPRRLGRWSNLTNAHIFQMGGFNHQLGETVWNTTFQDRLVLISSNDVHSHAFVYI